MTTDYNKTDGPLPTTRKQTGNNLQKTQSAFAQTIIHTVNRIFTNIILMADQEHTKGQDAKQLQALARRHSMQNHSKK